jgi:hypothetical protein
MSTDIAINMSNRVPAGSPIMNKPSYLITVEQNVGKSKIFRFFITLDKPELLNGFVQAKGLYADNNMTEDKIITSFSEILTSAEKELFLEVMLPWHKIVSIRSLVFRAK